MAGGIPYADIVIMALVAGFILLRLRSVLGDKTGNDSPSYFQQSSEPAKERKETVVKFDEAEIKAKLRPESDPLMAKLPDADAKKAVRDMKVKDPEFMLEPFLDGAKGAYEMVFDAYAKSDKDTLEFLLSDEVYKEFEAAIAARDGQEHKEETTLISVIPKGVESAKLHGNIAQLTVAFTTEQVSVTRNADGEVVEGDASAIVEVEDQWTFERDMTSRNPNWKVIET